MKPGNAGFRKDRSVSWHRFLLSDCRGTPKSGRVKNYVILTFSSGNKIFIYFPPFVLKYLISNLFNCKTIFFVYRCDWKYIKQANAFFISPHFSCLAFLIESYIFFSSPLPCITTSSRNLSSEMLRPMTASTSTSTTDSPPPQSPITPPQYEHQLPPFFKDVQIMDFEPRMGALISSSSSSPPTLARRPYCKHGKV